MEPTRVLHLVSRADSDNGATPTIDTGNATLNKLLSLLSEGFQGTIKSTSVVASLGISVAIVAAMLALFCFLRPHNSIVYAPRAKYADKKHTPPPASKNPLGWIAPVLKTKEAQLVEILGLDAAIFLRFTRMNRNMFAILTVVGCGIIIPVNLIAGHAIASANNSSTTFLLRLTPQYVYQSSLYWAYVVVAYLFDIVICYFLWHNYRAVVRLRRAYFDSTEYQQSLAARTLLVSEIPKDMRSDEGLIRIAEETMNTADVPRAAIGRNLKELPELVEEHTKTVEQLEAVLAKYLKNPNKVPTHRPTCEIHRRDAAYQRGKKVDAIEYLTKRIQQLERQVKETRETIDTRNALKYGFASYQSIETAHAVAYRGRKAGARKTEIRLAPKPHDIIWRNLALSKSERKRANFVTNIWVGLLTVAWILPNVFSAVFLSDLSNLGLFWQAFDTSLKAHPVGWGIVQGIAAPAIQSLFYIFLPAIFRRMSMKAGDTSKSSRDRHVLHKLFAFFVFNNLFIYSLFSALWLYILIVVQDTQAGDNTWDALKKDFKTSILFPVTDMSTFWLTWLLQRNYGAAIDLAQLVNLAWGSFSRRFMSPTPRDLIKLSAPPPFDYASYYNYFLFYGTVTLCYAPLQPLVLIPTAFYFAMDSYMKKYLLMYIYITKTESGGKFWRVLFNRVLFNAFFGNLVVCLVVAVQGSTWAMAISLAPLPFLLVGFKWYCSRNFDDQIDFYNTTLNHERNAGTGEDKGRNRDKVAVRFGHPVLYKPLITPMVHAKAQHLLKSLYDGRLDDDMESEAGGYSDVYMNNMARNKPGKAAHSSSPFEIVGENEMDFEHFKNRADFRDESGGDGELYGRSADQIRRGSASTGTDTLFSGRPMTPASHMRKDSFGSPEHNMDTDGAVYPAGYHMPTGSRARNHSVDSYSGRSEDLSQQQYQRERGRGRFEESRTDLLGGAADMGNSPPPPRLEYRSPSSGSVTRGWQVVDGYNAYTPTPQGYTPQPQEEQTSYDYFRGSRR